jgi:hypothetical protein
MHTPGLSVLQDAHNLLVELSPPDREDAWSVIRQLGEAMKIHPIKVHPTLREGMPPLQRPRGEHTPGPWTAKPTPASSYFDWSVEAKSGPGRVMSIGVMTDNTVADAKLIAAAPDLLAALRRTQALLFLRTDASDDEAMATLRAALAAIAKAQG